MILLSELAKHLAVNQTLPPLSIDTRTLQKGDLFVALDGANQTGQAFIAEAFKRGAVGAICAAKYRNKVQLDIAPEDLNKVFLVEYPVLAMGVLARKHRDRFPVEMVGITGSVGKTSTKEFLAYLLGRQFNLLATPGNLNNDLGLPMSLSRLNASHQMGIFEMGANRVGDITTLINILNPTKGILVPIAPCHLEGFGSLDKIYDTKLEILRSSALKVFVTVDDDPELEKRLQKFQGKVIRAGFSEKADIRIERLSLTKGGIAFELNGHVIQIPIHAPFLAMNAALAAAMALELGISWSNIEGTWNLALPKGRFLEQRLSNGVTVIDDTYNASPCSVAAAITTLAQLAQKKRAWLVFSDMLELGSESERLHRELAAKIEKAQLFGVWAFGEQAKLTIEELKRLGIKMNIKWFENSESLADTLMPELNAGDYVLLKGSRGMHVEEILKIWNARLSAAQS